MKKIMHVFSPITTVQGFDCAALSEARYQHGGDYHDVLAAEGCMGIAVGDVAGHDALAVAIKQRASILLQGRAVVPGALGPFMEGVNRDLGPHLPAGRFMTLFLAVLMADPRSIQWVSAGHGPVMVYDPVRNEFGEVPGCDIPLGVDATWRYHEQRHRGWSNGTLLVVGTDGIWEARNPARRMYGRRRLMATIRQAHHLPAQEIVRAVRDDLSCFRKEAPGSDDATLVVVKAV